LRGHDLVYGPQLSDPDPAAAKKIGDAMVQFSPRQQEAGIAFGNGS